MCHGLGLCGKYNSEKINKTFVKVMNKCIVAQFFTHCVVVVVVVVVVKKHLLTCYSSIHPIFY